MALPPLLRDRAAWTLGALYLLFTLFLCPLRGLQLEVHDEGGKYVFLPAALFDHSMDFVHQRKGYNNAYKVSPTGYSHHQWGIGPALLWSPFFLAGHGMARLMAAHGYPYPPDGYCLPYFLSVSLGSLAYGWAGLLLLYDLLRRLYGRSAGGLAAGVAFFSSFIPYHLFVRPIHDHGLACAGVSLVLWSFQRLRDDPSRKASWALLGAATGLTMTIRPDTPLVLLCLSVSALPLFARAVRERAPSGPLLLLACAAFFYAPQPLANRVFWGHWFGSGGDPSHSLDDILAAFHPGIFVDPRRWHTLLLGSVGGLLLQSPFLLLAFPGLLLRIRRDPFAAIGWLLFPLLLLAGLLALTDGHHGGPSWLLYRYLSDAAPILALGLAELLSRLGGRKAPAFRLAAVLGGLAIAWQALQCQQVENPLSTADPRFLARTLAGIPALGLPCRPSSLVRVWFVDAAPPGDVGWVLILAVLVLLAWMIAWAVLLDRPSSRALRTALVAAVLALLPVLAFELSQPRKTERGIYEATLLRIRLSAQDPWLGWDQELLKRAHALGARLGEDPRALLPVEGLFRFRRGDLPEAERLWRQALEGGESRLAREGLERIVATRRDADAPPPDPQGLTLDPGQP